MTGIAVRTGLLAIMAIAATQAEFPGLMGSDSGGNLATTITGLAFCGAGIATVYDVAQVSGVVRKHNYRRLHERPTVEPSLSLLDGSSVPAAGFTVMF